MAEDGSSQTGEDAPGTQGSQGSSTYVAMGDSYTAAPLYPLREDRQIRSCLRSEQNYPTLVADALGIDVVDVSCSGASTDDMFAPQRFGGESRPPQLDALTEETELVTLGIGANDFSYFSRMIFECLDLAEKNPRGSPCQNRNTTPSGRDRLERNLREIRSRVAEVVRAISERAPEARVLLVGYPQLLPEEGMCRARLPLAVGDYDYVRNLNLRLSRAVRTGGVRAGAEHVDLVAASNGHDICSDQPWVAGVQGDPSRAMGLHPFPAEQRAVARLILEML